MLHRILTAVDEKSHGNSFAVVANLIDWSSAFPRQCPRLGIEAFIKNGVRGSLIPVLINYFQDRTMSVKWHGCCSSSRKLTGGGPAGATLGLLEYLAQSNNCADCVDSNDRFRFLDDLSILEIINLLTIGLTSWDTKQQIPSDISPDQKFLFPENLQSQDWLNKICDWTKNQKMLINEQKSNTMIFNFSKDHQFTTRLKLNDHTLDVIEKTKLLGTVITNDLKWDANCTEIIKKANARMLILKKVASFGASVSDMKLIYTLYVRSILEHSATVWHSSLTEKNRHDLERVQKTALKIILNQRYKTYENALNTLNLETLNDRREQLCLKFAIKTSKHPRMKHLFPLNIKQHEMKTRHQEKYIVQHAHNERLKKSSIIYMQNLLNKHEQT